MPLATSLLLIAIGAVLAFAVTASVAGVSISTVGAILIGVGVVGLVLSLFISATARERDQTIFRDG